MRVLVEQMLHGHTINCLSSGINILAGGSSVPLISERKGTDPHLKHLRCTHFTSQHGSRDVIASLACVQLTSWPVAWNWRRTVLSADAGLLVNFGQSILKIPVINYVGLINFGPHCMLKRLATFASCCRNAPLQAIGNEHDMVCIAH